MPLIVDANRCGDFGKPPSNHAPEILKRIKTKRLKITVGGHLLKEIMATPMRALIVEWGRSGVLNRVDAKTVDDETAIIAEMQIQSDDPHIIALARVSNTRLLYSEDGDLIDDFKQRKLVSPRGKVIKPNTAHRITCTLFEHYGQ